MGIVKKDSIKNVFITYLGIGLGYLNKGLLFPLLLLPEEVGLANVIMLLAGFFAQFSNLGTGMILLRFLPFMKGEEFGYSGILRFTMKILTGGIVLITTILIVGNDAILNLFSDKSPLLVEYSFWILPAGIAGAFYILFEHYLRGISKNIISVFFQDFLQRILVLFALLAYTFHLLDFDSFITIFFCIHFVPAIALTIYLIYSKQFFIQKKHSKIRKKLKKLMFSYGLYVYFNSFGRNLVLMADTTMLAAMEGLETVGVYAIMVFLSNALFVPYVSLIRISAPLVPKYWKERKMEKMKSLYRKVTTIGFFITFLLFSIVWLNIDYILTFLPEIYATGKYVFLFLMLGRLFDSIGGINGDILLTSKKYKLEVIITVPLIFVTFALNYLFIPMYGGVGAALATSIVYLLYNIIRLIINVVSFKMHPFSPAFLQIIFIGGIMLFIGIIIPTASNFIINGLLKTAIPILLFFLPVYLLKLVPEINEFVKQILFKLKLIK